jgi:acyl-CoA synthetase (AMP-forming)/AMP-acid ligase II/thioesterase domain-containing protein
MLFDFDRFGAIHDIGLSFHWDRETFAREVNRRAVVLSQLGVGRGSIVAVAHAGSAHFFADLFSIWQVGAMAACIDPSLTSAEFRTVIDFARPLAVLVGQSLPSVALSLPVLQLAALPPAFAATPVVDICPDDDALMLFTSGTTGAPKGVVLSFGALQARLELNATAIGADSLQRALVTLPTHFGHGLIGNALTPLTNGGDIVLCPRGVSLGDQLGRIIDEHAITFLSSVPSLWKIALGSGRAPIGKSLLQVHVGSAPLSASLWSEIASWSRANVVNCYGMTEAANWIAGASSRSDGIADGLVGRPWGGVVAVMGDRGAIRQKGDGELVLQSPSLMRGYFDRPDLTAAVLSDGWLRTGDYGTVDELGQIWITGRIKDEINRAGFKVQAAELDLLLERHPDVAEACAFAVPDPITGQAIGVAIRPTNTDTIDLSSLRSWCRERLRRDAIPEHWFVVTEIPRSPRGKVNRAALHRALLGESDTSKQPIEVASGNAMRQIGFANVEGRPDEADIIRAVERAWTKVIDRKSFQANMPWRDVGGDSLRALSLLHDLERYLGRPIPLDLLRIDMTPSYLVRNILAIYNASGDQVGVSQPNPQLPLVFLMPPAYGDLPALAEFRSALSAQVRFHVIQYPSLSEIIDGGSRFSSIVDAAVRQISVVNDTDTYLLAGYSFGGLVAFEVARYLIDAGRRVDLLALIDTRLEHLSEKATSFFAKAIAYIGKTWSRPAKLYWDCVWLTLSLLAQYSSPALLRRIDDLTKRLPGSVAVALRIELSTLLRARATQGWNFKPLDVPTTLFRSDIAPGTRPDLGWGALCSRLAVRPACGDHRSLFEPRYRAALCAQFVASVYDALKSRQPVRSQCHSTGGDNQTQKLAN